MVMAFVLKIVNNNDRIDPTFYPGKHTANKYSGKVV